MVKLTYRCFIEKDRQWRWVIKCSNRRVIGSPETFESRELALQSLQLVKRAVEECILRESFVQPSPEVSV